VTSPMLQDRRPLVFVSEPSATGGRSEQSKEQGATVNIYSTPPSSSGRQRLHHCPSVSAVAPFPLVSFAFLAFCL
jgi:hypothetical protein